jgi:hypothetical protein
MQPGNGQAMKYYGLLVYYTHQALQPQTKKREELLFFSFVPPQGV